MENRHGRHEQLSDLTIGGRDQEGRRQEEQMQKTGQTGIGKMGIGEEGDETTDETTKTEVHEDEKKGGILQATGETVIEIAQSAKDIIVGRDSENKE